MMMSLFSIFDPMTSEIYSFNWLILFFPLILLSLKFYECESFYSYVFFKFILTLLNEFKNLINSIDVNLFMVSLMGLIFIYNFIGLFPYVYTLTSQMVFTVSYAMPLWLCMMLYGWLNWMNKMFIHLVPQGTPSMLMSFMVIIESISLLIRPLTLSIRLSANMIAGHLLLCLVGSTMVTLDTYFIIVIFVVQLGLYMLELGVSLIQAYVFSTLCVLYCSEVDY